jgi:lycopene cyclase domain-containing protein
MEKWTYALLLTGSILIPFIRSFETRVRFYNNWGPLFAGIFIMMLVFIPWDVVFTRMEVWSFNYNYVSGLYILDLPVEEWLFFVVIPYCCVFVYEVLKYFFPKVHYPVVSFWITLLLGLFTLVLAIVHTDRIYTFIVMGLASLLLFWQLIINSHKTWLSHFYFMFLVSLIPFFIVNGILTSFPVVSYDNTENLAIRLFTIPFEDTFYFMGMMFIVIMVYEPLKRKISNR